MEKKKKNCEIEKAIIEVINEITCCNILKIKETKIEFDLRQIIYIN